MARPERNTVDYFPHILSDGKKMFFIQHKHGNDGYATWFKILEKLATTEYHFLNLNNEQDILFLSAFCLVDEDKLLEIVADLAKIGAINQQLWNSKIIYSDTFIESIQDAYERRNNKCMNFEGLCKHLLGLGITLTTQNDEKDNINTQTKVNYTILNQTKPNKTIQKPDILEFLNYCNEILLDKFQPLEFSLRAKYEAWSDNDWKDGHNKPIKNWKSKIKNTIPFLKPETNGFKPPLNITTNLSNQDYDSKFR